MNIRIRKTKKVESGVGVYFLDHYNFLFCSSWFDGRSYNQFINNFQTCVGHFFIGKEDFNQISSKVKNFKHFL